MPLQPGEYQSGGLIWDSTGKPVVKARAPGTPLQAGDFYSGGRLFDSNGYQVVYSSGAGGGTRISDDFSTNTLPNYTFETDKLAATSVPADWQVSGGVLVPQAAMTTAVLKHNQSSPGKNHSARATYNSGSSGSTRLSLLTRIIDAQNFLYVKLNAGVPQMEIRKVDGGVDSLLANAAGQASASSVYTLILFCADNDLRVEQWDSARNSFFGKAVYTLVGADATKFGAAATFTSVPRLYVQPQTGTTVDNLVFASDSI